MTKKKTPSSRAAHAWAVLACAAGAMAPGAALAFAEKIPHSMSEGEGVIIASTRMGVGTGLGAGSPLDGLGQPADCSGAPLKVVVDSATGQQRWLYDEHGEPCNDASLLFDGATPLGSRAADPAVQIGFLDALGGVPMAESLPPVPRIVVNSELLGEGEGLAQPGQPVGAPAPATRDALTNTIQSWQGGLNTLQADAARREGLAETEATLAAVREINRTAGATAAQSDKVAALMAQLREKERELQAAKARADAAKNTTTQQRALTEATLTKAQQAEQNMRAELEAAKTRLTTMEFHNQQLAASKAKQEKLYQTQIATMGSDLKAAERQAQASRNELVAQAAAKIAEAEALANAARLAEADAKAREAARMREEAETMLQRAMDLQNNKAVIASGLEGATPKAAPMELMDVPVVVHAKGQTLEQLLTTITKQAEPQAGAWKSDFQLTKANSFILSEKWSLTAEAPVRALLDNLSQQIQSAHKVKLKFTQFPQSRLLVVTDE